MPDETIRPLPSKLDWARLAAFIDGEGCICITHMKTPQGKRHQFELHIGGTDPRLAMWCFKTFGVGHVYTRQHKNPKWRPLYCWQATGAKAGFILRGCYEYFIMKREQADIALAWVDLLRNTGKYTVSADNYNQREILKNKLHALKDAPAKELVN